MVSVVRMKSVRLNVLLPLLIASLIALAVLAVGLSSYFAETNLRTALDMLKKSRTDATVVLELVELKKGVEFDILHTQEALTDVSATRGLDGLDDGFSLADEFAAALKLKAARIIELATALGQPDMADKMGKLVVEFDHFHQAGTDMAKAYVSGGPEAGNRLMPSFDATAESLRAATDVVGKIVADVLAQQDSAAETRVMTLEASNNDMLQSVSRLLATSR